MKHAKSEIRTQSAGSSSLIYSTLFGMRRSRWTPDAKIHEIRSAFSVPSPVWLADAIMGAIWQRRVSATHAALEQLMVMVPLVHAARNERKQS